MPRRREYSPLAQARRAYSEYKQLVRMKDGHAFERNSFYLYASPRILEQKGLIMRVESLSNRFQVWYVITAKGKSYLRNNAQPPHPKEVDPVRLGQAL